MSAEPKDPLFAIFSFRLRGKEWIPVIPLVHVHAPDAATARIGYLAGLSPKERRTVKIEHVGLVVGYHVDDEHGEELSA